MTGIQIEFLLGLFAITQAFDGSLNQISVHWVRFIVGIILVVFAIYGIDLLTLR